MLLTCLESEPRCQQQIRAAEIKLLGSTIFKLHITLCRTETYVSLKEELSSEQLPAPKYAKQGTDP